MRAISTGMFSTVVQSGHDLVKRIKDLGFEYVELDQAIDVTTLMELAPAMSRAGVKAASVRHILPIPEALRSPDEAWFFSAPDAEERRTAIRFAKESIALAGRIGAKAVIVRCGQIDMDTNQAELNLIKRAGEWDSSVGRRVREAVTMERDAKTEETLARVGDCLAQLIGPANDAGLRIGIENGARSNWVPNSEDLRTLFETLDNTIGYWHDSGAALVQEHYGFDDQASLLGPFGSRTIGINLTDGREANHDLAPGSGLVDFRSIRGCLPGDAIKVISPKSGPAAADLRRVIDYLTETGIL